MRVKRQIAIVGGGWFGCYLAYVLKKKFDVKVFEKERNIFLGASGNNQNRLHKGFHYPRSYRTIQESKNGYKKFLKIFPFLTKKIKENLYLISSHKENLLDFKIYKQILISNNLKFKEIKKNQNYLNIEGIINSDEMMIDENAARNFFLKNLKNNLVLNYKINNISKINKQKKLLINSSYEFDYVINTTWETFLPHKNNNYTYEACVLFLYECSKKDHAALTIMDGPFITLYPNSRRNFTLYSVKYSRAKVFKKFYNCSRFMKTIPKKKINLLRKSHEQQISDYYPLFKKYFKFKKNIITYRTIINNANAERSSKVYINKEKNLINVLSGKIDHIFAVSEKVKKCVKY